jgi:hypothetical protein
VTSAAICNTPPPERGADGRLARSVGIQTGHRDDH